MSEIPASLVKRVDLSHGSMTKMLQGSRHSKWLSNCRRVDLQNETVRTLVCELYAADFGCFGYVYPSPQGCATTLNRTEPD